MTTLLFLDLTVIKGPNLGMRYSVPEHSFRILGRYEKGFIADEHILGPDLQELVLNCIPETIKQNRGPDILLDDLAMALFQGLFCFHRKQSFWFDFSNEQKQVLKPEDLLAIAGTTFKVS